MTTSMTLTDLHDAIAKAVADVIGHGMREKCERHADAVMAVVGPHLLASAASSPSSECGGIHEPDGYTALLSDGHRYWADEPGEYGEWVPYFLGNPPAQAAQMDASEQASEWFMREFGDLNPATACLVWNFVLALGNKLADAEKKYGYTDGWRSRDWMDECCAHLMQHIVKGDPRDVAAYCAFLWHHGASTAPTAEPVAQGEAVDPLQDDSPLQRRRAFVESWRLELPGDGHDLIANRNTVRRFVHIIDHLAAQPRAVPDDRKLVGYVWPNEADYDHIHRCLGGDGDPEIRRIPAGAVGVYAMLAATPSPGVTP